jgi:hypothetical protein
MPERWRQLRVGDRVRLVCVPESDLRQRELELRDGVEMPGWTADTLERILALDPVVTIANFDEYEAPWLLSTNLPPRMDRRVPLHMYQGRRFVGANQRRIEYP